MITISETDLDAALRDDLKRKALSRLGNQISEISRSYPEWQYSPVIDPMSHNRAWIFGGILVPIPKGLHGAPLNLFFVATLSGSVWSSAVEAEDDFPRLIDELPASLLPKAARPYITGTQPFNVDTGLGLPWGRGTFGRMSGGPHGNSGGRPYSAVDFVPDDKIIRAPAAGAFTSSCDGVRLRVDHGNGYSSQFYHVDDATALPPGSIVSEGDYLGRISSRIDCGGKASGPHVHAALKRNGEYVPVNGLTMGGWTFYEGDVPYGGKAVDQRTGTEAKPGGKLFNYGAQSGPDDPDLPEGIVDVGEGNHLFVRSGPSKQHPKLGRLQHGAKVRIRCTARGQLLKGNLGTSDLWNQVSGGGWVADAWLDTGSDGPVATDCACSSCP